MDDGLGVYQLPPYTSYQTPMQVGIYDIFAEFEVFGKKGSPTILRERLGSMELTPTLTGLILQPVGMEVTPTVRELNPHCFSSENTRKASRKTLPPYGIVDEKLDYPVSFLVSLCDRNGNSIPLEYCAGAELTIQINATEGKGDNTPVFKATGTPSIQLSLQDPDPSHPLCLCFSARDRILDLDVDRGDYGTYEVSLSLAFPSSSLSMHGPWVGTFVFVPKVFEESQYSKLKEFDESFREVHEEMLRQKAVLQRIGWWFGRVTLSFWGGSDFSKGVSKSVFSSSDFSFPPFLQMLRSTLTRPE
jgi:hypothetical protein